MVDTPLVRQLDFYLYLITRFSHFFLLLSRLHSIQIFSLDFGSSEHELKLAGGAVQAPERFARLAWGAPGADHATYPVRYIFIQISMPSSSPTICCVFLSAFYFN
jgi:hypothetical protein